MLCTRTRSWERANDAKSCAVGMCNAILGNHLNRLRSLIQCAPKPIKKAALCHQSTETNWELPLVRFRAIGSGYMFSHPQRLHMFPRFTVFTYFPALDGSSASKLNQSVTFSRLAPFTRFRTLVTGSMFSDTCDLFSSSLQCLLVSSRRHRLHFFLGLIPCFRALGTG